MSDEYTNLGTVRRRPRAGHQRPGAEFEPGAQAGASGKHHGANGANGANGHSHAQFEEEFQDSAFSQSSSRRRPDKNEDRRERRRKEKSEDKRDRPLPWREIEAEAPLFRCPFDPWRLFGAVKRRTFSMVLVGALLALIGVFAGAYTVPYKMSLPLIRKTSNAVRSESAIPNQFTPREYSDGTLYAFMKSSDVIRNVVEKARTNALLAPLNITWHQIARSISVVPMANPDFVFLKLKTFGSMRSMAELINLYGQESVDQLRDVQRRESAFINTYLKGQLATAEQRIADITTEMRKLSDSGFVAYDRETDDALSELSKLRVDLRANQLQYDTLDAQLASLDESLPNTRLLLAKQELQNLLITRTEKHPDVTAKRREIEFLEKQQQSGTLVKGTGAASATDPLFMRRMDLSTSKPKLEKEIQQISSRISAITNNLAGRKEKDMSYALRKAEFESQAKARDELARAAREAQLYAEASLGYFGILEPATEGSIDTKNRWLKVALLGLFCGLAGMLVVAGIALVGEALDTTLKTPEDIMRVCKLPVLASMGDLRKMSAKQQADWAFRTLTLLKGKLVRNQDQALVCGIISAKHGEGRSTWVNLLVNAASQRGLRVLTVDTRPGTAAPTSAPPKPPPKPAQETAGSEKLKTEASGSSHSINLPDGPSNATVVPVVKDPLDSPEKVAEHFEVSTQPLVHIPLPGWVWSLERRKQWQNALDSWKHIDNLVIFVELPPACESESVLLAENLPQVVWLVGSGMADAAESAVHLETLRHAHCNLVGAVLNHAPPPFLNIKIGRWLNPVTALAVMLGSLCFGSVAAEKGTPPQSELQMATARPAGETLAFGANAKRQRAKWQQRLTFGPGDSVDIHFYGNPALTRTNVFIGPDGRINYLQATGVTAAGLTVEELRQKLDEELVTYYPSVRTIVQPVSFSSKKYFMLGKVNAKGAYILDRPLTLLEAVARARGLETGLYQRTTVEMADLGHSFIVREGEKLPINFEKLFLEGDLSQNIAMEPNDYVFFASTGGRDIYVLGEVVTPGPLGFVDTATVLTAITDRGGFTERAFKRRVLVVRGSLNEPETFVINTDSALDGYLKDFRLRPKDIVYIGHRPWVKAEELLDEAAAAFIEGAVTTWAGINVGPIITKRLFPGTRPRPR